VTLLLYLLFALVATWGAARWVYPIALRDRLVLGLLPLVATGWALATGRVQAPIDLPWASQPLAAARAAAGVELVSPGVLHDVHSQMIPWRKAVRWAFAHGEAPLSNPFMLAGDPLAPSAVPAAWHPVNLLALAAPLPQSLTLAAAATLLVAALGMFLAARDAGAREEVALVAAAGWTFSSYLGFWLEWPQGPCAAATPLVWLAARRAAREPGVESALLLAFGCAWLLLAGHPESAFFAVVAAVALFAFELGRARLRRLRAALLTGLAGGALALGLTALDWLPFADALDQTIQHAERRAIYAEMERAAPIDQALENLRPNALPFVHGVEGLELLAPPRVLHAPAATAYAGSLLVACALYGLVRARDTLRLALAGLLAAGLALAVKLPVWVDLLRRLPLFDISLPEYGYLWAAPALVLLAALGLERGLSEERRGERRRLAWALALWALASAAGILYWKGEMIGRGLSAGFVAERSAWLLVPLLGGIAAVAFLPRPRFVAFALLALVVVQRRGELGHLYPSSPASACYPLVAPLARLPRGGEPYRIVGVHYLLPPNSATMWELEDARGYNAMTLRRLAETYPLWASDAEYWFNRIDELKPFLSLLGVRFALAPPDYRVPQGWRRVEGSAGWSLLENSRALRRAFVPRTVYFGGTAAERLEAMRRTRVFDRHAWLEPAARSPAAAASAYAERNAHGQVTRIERQGSGYRMRVEMEAPGWVVVSVAAWRGWRASAAGRPLPMAIADHALMAFEAPAGTSDVELVFRPRSFVWGVGLSIASAAALAALALYRRWRLSPLSGTTPAAG
jgi:hypothetical protein